MSLTVPRASLPAAIALALVLTAPEAEAQLLGRYNRVVEVLPTVYSPTVLAAPTTSYVTTSYLTPTRYSSVLYPTIYSSSILTPTTYVTPTSYVTSTSYLVPTVFRPRWRSALRPVYTTSRTYAYDLTPTRYVWSTYWPTTTTLEVPVAVPTTTTVSAVEDCYVAPASATVVSPSPAINSAPSQRPTSPSPINTRPPSSLESRPNNGQSVEPEPLIPDGPAPAAPPREEAPGFEPGLEFPGQPTPEKGLPPISPPTETEPGSSLDDQASRAAYRPAATDMTPRPGLPTLGALRGSVISGTGMAPQAGVRVVFTDSRGRYGDRETTSGDDGLFEVTLPDGDWLVNIEDDEGKLTPYGNVTVASGRFFDERGRVVSSLRLHH